jgi:ABC-2 type transport system ATP-binding protein
MAPCLENPMNQTDLVVVENLRRARGSFMLEIPHWTVPSGVVVGVVGPNGAGKTTLLRLLPGLDRAHGGAVKVFGLEPWKAPEKVRLELGFMSDDQALFNLRIHKLLWVLSGYYPSWDAALVDQLLERFQLDPSRKVSQLSKGEAVRIRLVVAMAHRPRLLVLDEPAAGLDLAGRRALLETVLEVVGDERCSVIISSHQLTDLERITDRLLVIHGGKVMHEGATDELVPEGQTLEEAMVGWRAL